MKTIRVGSRAYGLSLGMIWGIEHGTAARNALSFSIFYLPICNNLTARVSQRSPNDDNSEVIDNFLKLTDNSVTLTYNTQEMNDTFSASKLSDYYDRV